MTTTLWCLLPAIFLPYVWSTIASIHRKRTLGTLDNNDPRGQQAKVTTGPGARAHYAQLNAWEALAVFAPCVIVAHIGHKGSTIAPILALVWVAARIAHGVTYIADKATVRSILFTVASVCSLGLFLIGARVF